MSAVTKASPIHSDFASDPDLAELVEQFVEELPDRLSEAQRAFSERDFNRLKRIAHQLKGAVGSYGFDSLTPFAATVETAAGDPDDDAALQRALARLNEVCQRVRSGMPASSKSDE